MFRICALRTARVFYVALLFSAAFSISIPRLLAEPIVYAAAVTSFTARPEPETNSVFGALDLSTGAFTQTAAVDGLIFNDIALSTNGTLYAIATLYPGGGPDEGTVDFGTIDPSTGQFTAISTPGVALNSLAFNADGTLYAQTYDGQNSDALYTIDPNSGNATFVATLQGAIAQTSGDIRFLGDNAYITIIGTNSSQDSDLYSLNLSTGAGTLIGDPGVAGYALTGSEDGELLATGDVFDQPQPGEIIEIDPNTGDSTEVASTNLVYGFTTVNSTPEPGSLALVFCGMFCLFARLTRHRTQEFPNK